MSPACLRNPRYGHRWLWLLALAVLLIAVASQATGSGSEVIATETPETEPPTTETPETDTPETDTPETDPPATTTPTPTTRTPSTTSTTSPSTTTEAPTDTTLPPSTITIISLSSSTSASSSAASSMSSSGSSSQASASAAPGANSNSNDTANGEDSASSSPQSGSSAYTKSSSSLSLGALVGIIAGGVVLMLILFAFFFAQRRRHKHRDSAASSNDVLDPPVVGKTVRILGPTDAEYREMTATTGNSYSIGGSNRNSMWEDPVILASRIPIDRVELGNVIGRGAFGEVFRGRYRDHDVAIKTLFPEKRKDLVHIQEFLSEVRLMATMEHPHVVHFIGVAWESLSEVYCVTEFMNGGDLRTLLQGYLANGFPKGMDKNKMRIAYQVAYALTYLHSLEPVVLHRDLKSRNILLTKSLDAKITDFGASRVRSDATMTSGVGSSLWMAPEVMMGGYYDEKADVFSLGVVISELDTHELPYANAKEGNSSSGRSLPDTAVLQMVATGKLRVSFSPNMPPEMARYVERCVSVNPLERPTAAEVLYFLQVALRDQQ